MNPEAIVAAMLNQLAVTSLVSTRRALSQLPENTTYPALVYQVIDAVPQPVVNFAAVGQRAQARVQINPLATTVASVKEIHAAVRSVMDFKHQVTFAGKTVVSCRLDMIGPADKDEATGIWTQPADYMLIWVE